MGFRKPAYNMLRLFAYGSVVSTYILIVIGGYVTTSNSGGACGESPGASSWPLCNGGVLPDLNNAAQVIEYTHRIFNLVVAFFVVGTAILAWTRYRQYDRIMFFASASFMGLFAQVILGMVTVTTALNPIVSDAHLGLAVAVFALIIVNAVNVWNTRTTTLEIS